ncbi:hypothetical protein AMTR_s00122p00116220 [Amborella trichopoda]|uniref:Uncharacterized protein n=1 Tax=Amborella trichopoda TaxID=13333 RepID=W1NPR9_AMBTC|nr:hypothetical protein AMTR_s00122p00116220 [Amborella trichopoda]
MATTLHSFLLVSLLLATTVSSTFGLMARNTDVLTVNIRGVLYCSVDGNLDPGAIGLGRVPVFLQCGPATATIALVLTDRTGAYFIAFSVLDAALFDPSACFIYILISL